jgi:chromosome partitioning protein
MILTVGNTKGGVGKSTLAVSIASALAREGRDVWLINADRQKTSQMAIAVRAQDETLPGIACATYTEGPLLRSQVKLQAHKFHDVIIDAGGRDSSAFRVALMLSDKVLMPFVPRTFEVWAMEEMAELVDEARGAREHFPVLSVLNTADPDPSEDVRAADNEQAIAELSAFPQFEYIDTPLVRRKAFSSAAGQGLSVLEMKKADPKARAEFSKLLAVLLSYPSDMNLVSS